MAALSKKLRSVEGDKVSFWCPGCDKPHMLPHGDGRGHRWDWNGDAEKPTFRPSVLATYGEDVCHSFVTGGQIRFLGDSTHALAGKTVDLPDWTELDV